MMTDELFFKMDLTCVYDGNRIIDKIDKNKYYVYVIKSIDSKYYVGLSRNLTRRLTQHVDNNTNDIKEGGEMYILEELNDEVRMINMEKIWIRWFKMTSLCINKIVDNYLITIGAINTFHIINIWSITSCMT